MTSKEWDANWQKALDAVVEYEKKQPETLWIPEALWSWMLAFERHLDAGYTIADWHTRN